MLPRSPAVFSLLSYFRVPEFMADFEKLSVASLSAVRRAKDGAVRFVGPAHVAEPYRFRNYYPEQEWLAQVTREHVRCFVGVHEPNGALRRRFALQWQAHESLDIIVGKLELDAERSELLTDAHELMRVDDDAATAGEDDVELDVHGYVLRDDNVCMERQTVSANVWSSDDGTARRFIHTAVPLTQGMCGGAVVSRHAPRNLFGIVEGVVRTGPLHLVGTAALIRRDAIQKFGDVL
jgi:hypothetical protein